MYYFYLGKMLCPIAPSKVQFKINNNNKTMELINNGEINILKDPGLTEIEFDLLLPNVKYPFAVYKNGFKNANAYLKHIERMKVDKRVVQFIITRKLPDGKLLFDTNIKVSLEDYKIEEDNGNGFDFKVSIKLKQYRDYSTKICEVEIKKDKKTITKKKTRETTNSPAPKTAAKNYTVVKGDSLWKIARKFYGDGGQYKKIENANKDEVSNPNKIYPGQVLIIPV